MTNREPSCLVGFVLIIAVLIDPTTSFAQGKGKLTSTIVKIIVGGTAAYAAGNAAHASDAIDKSTRDASVAAMKVSQSKVEEAKFESLILKRIGEQGVDASKSAIYSVYFSLDNNASSVYWADWWSKADIFFCFDLEGHGTYLMPEIRYEYNGGPVLARILAQEAIPESKIVVRVMDDDTSSDEVWKSLLRTRINLDITGGLQAPMVCKVQAGVSGLQVLSNGAAVVLDSPDEIARVEIPVPSSDNGTWRVEAELKDSNHHKVGTIQVSCVWSARGERAAFEAERSRLERKISLETKVKSGAKSSFWFWSVAGCLAAIWFIVLVFKEKPKAGSTL